MKRTLFLGFVVILAALVFSAGAVWAEFELGSDPRSTEEVLKDFPNLTGEARERAALTLAFRDVEEGIPLILGALAATKDAEQAALARALSRYPAEKLRPVLEDTLTKEDKTLLAGVLIAIGEMGDRALAPKVPPFFDDQDAGVRRAAALAGGKLRLPEAAEPLSKILHDPDATLQTQALEGLEALKSPEAAHAVRERYRVVAGGSGDFLTYRYLLALASFPGAETVALVKETENTIPAHIRRWIPWVLGRSKSKEALPLLQKYLTGADEEMRQAAVEGLGASGLPEAGPLLLEFFKSHSGDEQYQAASALAHLSGTLSGERKDVVVGYLLDQADEKRQVSRRLEALTLLGKFRDEASAETLEQWMAKEQNEIVKREMEATVAKLRGQETR